MLADDIHASFHAAVDFLLTQNEKSGVPLKRIQVKVKLLDIRMYDGGDKCSFVNILYRAKTDVLLPNIDACKSNFLPRVHKIVLASAHIKCCEQYLH